MKVSSMQGSDDLSFGFGNEDSRNRTLALVWVTLLIFCLAINRMTTFKFVEWFLEFFW